MSVIKQHYKMLTINEIKQVTKGRGERGETKGTEQLISREMKRKNKKDDSGLGFMIPPKYIKKVTPGGEVGSRY